MRFSIWLALVWSTLFSVIGASHLLFDPAPETRLQAIPDRFTEVLLEPPVLVEPVVRARAQGNSVQMNAARAASDAALRREEVMGRAKELSALIGTRGESNSGEVVEDLLGDDGQRFGNLGDALRSVEEGRDAREGDARERDGDGERTDAQAMLQLPQAVPTAVDPVSTFAVDVDTASYQRTRSLLRAGRLPQAAQVRPEELINAQRYAYDAPRTEPLAVDAELSRHPLRRDRHLLRVGLQARLPADGDRAPVHLVFLVDTSGSMGGASRMGLLKESLRHLVGVLDTRDRVSLVAFDTSATVLLPPTPVADRELLLSAIDRLRTGGGTNLEAGLRRAYDIADALPERGRIENRVVVLSDGGANVGWSSSDELSAMVARRSGEGVTLTSVAFATGGRADRLMEQLADRGDGYAVYIDGPDAIADAFGHRLGAMVQTVARDAKIQVEFDPAVVRSWRLVGYDNRQLADADFRVDAVDAGEIGAGHQVTALYELDLITAARSPGEVRLRWKPPGLDAAATERSVSLPRVGRGAGPDSRVALASGSFGEALRYVDAPAALAEIEDLLSGTLRDAYPEDRELLELVRTARALREGQAGLVAARR